MSYAAPSGMVMTSQDGAAQAGEGWDVQVTEAVLPAPPALVDQDDVGAGPYQHPEWTQAEDLPETPVQEYEPRWLIQRVELGRRRPAKFQARSDVDAQVQVEEVAEPLGEVALNTMRSTQPALARMESTQAVQAERLRQAVHALQAEAALCARHAYWAEYTQGSHREAEAAARRTAQEEELKKALDEQRRHFEQWIKSLEDQRHQDQTTIRYHENVQRIRSRNIPTPSTHIQGDQATPAHGLTVEVKREPLHPAMDQESSGVIKRHAGDKSDGDLRAAQLL
ncbi:reverse transcriptase [Phytophthora cinnamomi]|uniref:reverse transcriptase n=1 Tax=Phytophthora cinnamomi TaxID=4785 RepID=UPI00355A7F92|nr:reverse transcriptase [Phytophthora cinnamomi]